MIGVGNVAHTGDMRNMKFWLENLKEIVGLGGLYGDGRAVLKLVLEEKDGRMWNGFI
jgi:ABC-type sugar transport system ATPase subunit